ncbi:heterokaryon incompatibility protein-domain-containing protein [Cadophora sp. MPI-SDFR-AT-0126]|nr:heterokaryon incompatibility protein-domain-containing protein [Leotiomycetes sp. MPI-SDFR-AT-0126]
MPEGQVSSLSLCRRCQSFNFTDLRAYDHDRNDRERNPPMIINRGELAHGCQMCLFIREALGIEISDMNAIVEIIAKYRNRYQSNKLRDCAKHLILEGIWRLEKYGIRRYFPINLIRIKTGSKEVSLHVSANLHDNQEILKRVKGRPILDPKSNESMSRMGNWLETCLRHHNGCNMGLSGRNISSQKLGHLLPKRLIEVGEEKTRKARCVLSSSIQSAARYAALSYCWGSSDSGHIPVVLEKNNSDQFHEELPVGSVPKTIQEAIEATRRLSIPFLWVDSLCIMQDDEKEWAEEGSRMCEIYEGATVTIVALAAHDSSEGLFFDREDTQSPTSNTARSIKGPTLPLALTSKTPVLGHVNLTVFPRHQEIFEAERSWQHELDSSTWNTRCWTLQERLLSRRILYFGKYQIFWNVQEEFRTRKGSLTAH